MATGQLSLYNIAVRAIGERTIDSLSDAGEPRRELDTIWSSGNGAVRYFLEQGYWTFAIRTQELDEASSVTTSFGYAYAFTRPTDMVRLMQISLDERFSVPLNNYEIETGYFFAENKPLYVRYVSDDGNYGGDYSLWPESFSLWAGHWLATQIAPRLRTMTDLDALEARTHRLLIEARNKCAMEGPARFPPVGSWVQARRGRYGAQRRERTSQLIGD